MALDSRQATNAELAQLLEHGEQWRVRGYEGQIQTRRDFYEGRQLGYVASLMRKRAPHTHAFMEPYSVPIFRHLTEQRATIYRASPTRVVQVAGDLDTDKTELVERVYREALADTAMQTAEQYAAACGLSFVRVGWDPFDERVTLTPWWPDSVWVIPHPSWPTRIDRALALIAEVQSADGIRDQHRTRRYEVWTRDDQGQWSYSVMRSDGLREVTPGEPQSYPFLPWVAFPFQPDAATLFELPGPDDIKACTVIGALYTELHYTIQMQAHTQVYYSGPEIGELVGGPGAVWKAGEAGEFGTLVYQPQISAVQTVIDETISRLLVTYGLSPSTVSIDPRYESGVALKVQNAPMIEKRQARVPFIRRLEETSLWRAVHGIWDHHMPADAFGADAALRWSAGALELPIDDEAEMRVSQQRVEQGISTWAIEMVRLGLADTLSDAVKMREAFGTAGQVQPPPVPNAPAA